MFRECNANPLPNARIIMQAGKYSTEKSKPQIAVTSHYISESALTVARIWPIVLAFVVKEFYAIE